MKLPLIQHSKYSAFTLFEFLIVTFIIIILSTVVLANYEFGGYRFALKRSAHKLAQDFRRAEEMAMSAREFEGAVPVGGYGIYIDWESYPTSTRYILFADLDGDTNYDENEKIELIEFEDYVEINQACIEGLCEYKVPITFVPPSPTVKFDNKPAASYAFVELRSRKVEGIITVFINKAGLIEIQ